MKRNSKKLFRLPILGAKKINQTNYNLEMFFVTCVLLCKRKVCSLFLNFHFKDEFDFFYKLNEHGLVRECIKRRRKKNWFGLLKYRNWSGGVVQIYQICLKTLHRFTLLCCTVLNLKLLIFQVGLETWPWPAACPAVGQAG